MEEIFEKLSEKIIKEEDLVFFLDQLNSIKKVIFLKPQIPLSERLKNKIDEKIRKEIEKLEKEKILPSLPEEQLSFFEGLKNFLLKIPKVSLEIAFEPSDDFILEIDKWFKEKIKRKVILDIFVNPKIVGGIKIEYQGKWGDFSLEKEIKKLYGGI
jgi:F0F1-type ATP synthase delta subunit